MSNASTSPKSLTDWDRVDAMEDKDIDLSDCPEVTATMFAQAIVRKGLKPVQGKQQVTLRIDSDVLDWFKSQGSGYQASINTILRTYKNAHVIVPDI